MGVNQIAKLLPAICERAENTRYTNHSLRATYITLAHQAGISDVDIQARTGHRSLEGLNAYKHATGGHVQSVQQAMAVQFAEGKGRGRIGGQSVQFAMPSAPRPMHASTFTVPKGVQMPSIQAMGSQHVPPPGNGLPVLPSGCDPNLFMMYTMMLNTRR